MRPGAYNRLCTYFAFILVKKILDSFLIRRGLDFLLSPLTLLACWWFKYARTGGTAKKMPVSEFLFMKTGVLPVVDHYYQPLVNPKRHLTRSLRQDRPLAGIDMNETEQLALLAKFHYNEELLIFPTEKPVTQTFYYNNNSFLAGDAEYLYNVIRHYQPKRIIEVGSGHSTLMAINAVKQNRKENTSYTCEHICIEPYEMPWLEKTGVKVIRQKVEEVNKSLFETLQKDDIFFIDSSHVLRPQGDVLFEYLEVLPLLNPGVLVHIHDVFTPKDYLDEWIYDKHLLWNEQYLLEAFLTFNNRFRIVGALNYLMHHHYAAFAAKCPVLAQQGDKEPGSFWLVKND